MQAAIGYSENATELFRAGGTLGSNTGTKVAEALLYDQCELPSQ